MGGVEGGSPYSEGPSTQTLPSYRSDTGQDPSLRVLSEVYVDVDGSVPPELVRHVCGPGPERVYPSRRVGPSRPPSGVSGKEDGVPCPLVP